MKKNRTLEHKQRINKLKEAKKIAKEKVAANANKLQEASKNKKKEEAIMLSDARRMDKLRRAGVSQADIEKLAAEAKTRIVLCLYYNKYTVEVEEKGKKTILRNADAAMHYFKGMKYDVISSSKTYAYIKTDNESVDELVENLRENIGRCIITKPTKLTVAQTIEKLHPKPKQPKKPTNNTPEVRKAAKKKRKEANKKKAAMRPFYAALRKGGVSQRIKKFNKPLAEKIEKWLKEQRKAEEAKAEEDKEYRAKHRQLTNLEKKSARRAKKAIKSLERKQKIQAYEKKNSEKKANNAKKTPKQTKLNIAA